MTVYLACHGACEAPDPTPATGHSSWLSECICDSTSEKHAFPVFFVATAGTTNGGTSQEPPGRQLVSEQIGI